LHDLTAAAVLFGCAFRLIDLFAGAFPGQKHLDFSEGVVKRVLDCTQNAVFCLWFSRRPSSSGLEWLFWRGYFFGLDFLGVVLVFFRIYRLLFTPFVITSNDHRQAKRSQLHLVS
jgi:hypothetical protein